MLSTSTFESRYPKRTFLPLPKAWVFLNVFSASRVLAAFAWLSQIEDSVTIAPSILTNCTLIGSGVAKHDRPGSKSFRGPLRHGWEALIYIVGATLKRLVCSGAILLLSSLSATPVVCQEPSAFPMTKEAEQISIRGIVHDSAGRPLEGAEVRSDSASVVLTGSSGEFSLLAVRRAELRLHVRRLGFVARDTNVSLAGSDSPRLIDITLSASMVQLGTIVVEGRALDTRLWNAGFYKRARLGVGRFVGPDELERFVSGLATVLRETPRVQVNRQNNQDYAYARAGGHRCRMNVFVDGQFARYANPGTSGTGNHDSPDPGVGLNDLVPREDIRAVEIYPSLTSVPSQFMRIGPASNQSSQGRAGRIATTRGSSSASRGVDDEGPSDAACGAIVIWTRWYAATGAP